MNVFDLKKQIEQIQDNCPHEAVEMAVEMYPNDRDPDAIPMTTYRCKVCDSNGEKIGKWSLKR